MTCLIVSADVIPGFFSVSQTLCNRWTYQNSMLKI